MKERELPNKPKPSRLEILFESLDREKQTVRKKELVGEIVREATEEHEDCVPILLTMTNAFEMFLPGKKQDKTTGQLIINGIDSYFDGHGMCFKWLAKKDISNEDFNRMLVKFSRLGSLADARGMRMSRGGREFAFAVDRAFEALSENKDSQNNPDSRLPDSRSDQTDWQRDFGKGGKISLLSPPPQKDEVSLSAMMVMIVADNENLKDKEGYLKYKNETVEILQESQAFISDSIEEIDRIRTPEKIWKVVQEVSRQKIEGLPDFQNEEFGGSSLLNIISEPEPEKSVQKLMAYIGNMPKGNLMWQILLSGLFFTTSYGWCNKEDKGQIENPQFMLKIFSIQKLITEKLLLPAFSGEKDPLFDSSFGPVLKNLDELSLKILAFLIRSVAINGPEIISLFMDKRPQAWDLIDGFPLNETAINRILEKDPTKPVLSDDATLRMLKEGLELIFANWQSRFGRSLQIKYLEAPFNLLMRTLESGKQQALNLSAIAVQNLGDKFLKDLTMVDQRAGGFKMPDIMKTEWSGRTFKGDIGAESAGGKLGFSSIEFYTGDTVSDPTAFQLKSADGWVVMGRINSEGRLDYLSADFGEERSPVKALMEWIPTCFYFSLLYQEGMIGNIPFSVRSMIFNLGMEDEEKGILYEVSVEDIEAEAAKIYETYGGKFNYSLLKQLNRVDMKAAIRRYPGGMHALREKIGFQPKEQRITPDEINQKMSAILEALEELQD